MYNMQLQIVVLSINGMFWRSVPMKLPWLVIWLSSVFNEFHKSLLLKRILQILCVLYPVHIQLWPIGRFRHGKIKITRTALYLRNLNINRRLSLTCQANRGPFILFFVVVVCLVSLTGNKNDRDEEKYYDEGFHDRNYILWRNLFKIALKI